MIYCVILGTQECPKHTNIESSKSFPQKKKKKFPKGEETQNPLQKKV